MIIRWSECVNTWNVKIVGISFAYTGAPLLQAGGAFYEWFNAIMYKFENTGSNQSSAPLEEIIREEEGGGTGVITRERLR